MKHVLHDLDGQPVEAPAPATRDCGCTPVGYVPVVRCALHLTLESSLFPTATQNVIIRALFAVAGRVAANETPADAVANVRERWGL